MSKHQVKVFILDKIEKHPNADSLGIVRVGGFQCCVKLGDFNSGDHVAFIEPDSIVPVTQQFAFLSGHNHIKVRKLRGVYSQGLLIKAPPKAIEGDDVMELLGISHYEPPEKLYTGGENVKGPSGFIPIYDVETFHKFPDVLTPGEYVRITEKRHGCNTRFVFKDGEFFAGSHKTWKKQTDSSIFWKVSVQNPWIPKWCFDHQGFVLYGETFGQVQDLKYDAGQNQLFFEVFDIWNGREWEEVDSPAWENVEDCGTIYNQKVFVPLLYEGPFDKEKAFELAEGKSSTASCIREGCVIRPMPERVAEYDGGLHRVQFKIVGNGYYERKQ